MIKNTKFYLLILLLVISVILSLILKEPRKKVKKTLSFSPPILKDSLDNRDQVLILELMVPISYAESPPLYFKRRVVNLIEKIDQAARDERVHGLILRVNSPGGTVGASQELYQAAKRFRQSGKPFISSIIDLCASGAYYAVLPSNLIIANPGSIVGSIGVRITSPNLTKLYRSIGIDFNQITSAKYKDILSSSRKMRPEEKAHLEKMVKETHEQFVSDVISWRQEKSDADTIRQASNGLIYTANQAKKIGLIDQLGDLNLAKKEMAKLLTREVDDLYFFFDDRKSFLEDTYNFLEIQIKTLLEKMLQAGLNYQMKMEL